jgi:hypothetical protein
MNDFRAIETMGRLQRGGFKPQQASALAGELESAMSSLVTREQLEAALNRQLIRMGIMTAAIVSLACTLVGVAISNG